MGAGEDRAGADRAGGACLVVGEVEQDQASHPVVLLTHGGTSKRERERERERVRERGCGREG